MAAKLTFVFLAVLAAATAPLCLAQRHGGFNGSSHGGAFRSPRGSSSFYNHRRSDLGAYFWGDPFFWYGDDTTPQPPPEPGSPVLILRPESSPQAKLSPLLIELEDGRYVRHGATAQSEQSSVSHEPRTRSAPKPDYAARHYSGNEESGELTPTMLIFRDAHREQVSDYAIVGRVLYAHSDLDGEPGYGLKNIQISELDIPATIRANRENGVSFMLPSGPNEVVTRP
jgi:hypothetical protein